MFTSECKNGTIIIHILFTSECENGTPVMRAAFQRQDCSSEEHERCGEEGTEDDADGHLLHLYAVLRRDDVDRRRGWESAIQKPECRQFSVVGKQVGRGFLK